MIRPTIRQLEYVVAVADHLSFHRAADACHVTQPGLSTQIRQLESYLDVQVFERDRRKVLVTPAGQEVVRQARAVLAAVDELVDAAKVYAKPLPGTLRLGVIPTIAAYLLPECLPTVRDRYPELRLLLREEQTAVLLRLLAEGRLDVLLLALEAELGDVDTMKLFEDPFVVAVPRSHRLAKKKAIRTAELAGEQVLLLDDGHCLRGQTASVCRQAGAEELGDFRASSLTTLAQMVASGLGVTLLPAMALHVEADPRDELTTIRFAAPEPRRTIGLAWRRTSSRAEEFAVLGRLLAGR